MAIIIHNGTCTANTPLLDDIRIARETGYDGIEIIGPKLDLLLGSGGTLDEVRRALDGFPAKALGFVLDIERQEPAEYRALIEETRMRIQQTVALGAEYLELVTGPLGPGLGITGGYSGLVGKSRDEVTELSAKNLRVICDMAGEHGLRLYLEPLAWASLCRLDQCLEVIDLTGRANLGMVIDFWHLWINGTEARDIAKLDKRYINGVHACDSLPRFAPGAQVLHNRREVWTGGGQIPLQDWIDALKTIGYDGWYSAEMFAPQFARFDPAKVSRMLREHLQMLLDDAVPYGTRPVPAK